MGLVRLGAVLALTLALAACASPRPALPPSGPPASYPPTFYPPEVEPPQVPTRAPPPGGANLSTLPGWANEDHRAALDAYRAGCDAAKDTTSQVVCARARTADTPDDASARRFLEAHFKAQRLAGDGLLTAYFAPQYEARRRPSAEFSAPLRPKPDDLVTVALSEFEGGANQGSAKTAIGRDRGGKVEPYPDRATIEATGTRDALAWLRPEDLYFLQIQGSGLLTFEDGRRLRAAFAAHNGQPYVGIAAPMRDKGLLADNNTSGDAIRRWLADHRGPEANAIMALNPRYVFFTLGVDDGREAVGAAGRPLPAGRAIAVDLSQHPLGGLFWIDASAPRLTDAFPVYRRAVVALDTGGAIKGHVRADLYTGTGPVAGTEAGRVRHSLTMYRLVPVP